MRKEPDNESRARHLFRRDKEPVYTTMTMASIQRGMADAAFMDGFMPLPTAESMYATEREYLRSQIIEQDDAIDAIIEALDRSSVRSDTSNRPIASFAFLGPTGVGKTQTAKALTELLSSDPTRLLKIDCSNYASGHEVARLTGSPVGYVGHGQEPYLSKKQVERPGTVILFDEVEKGSSQLFNLLLQILDEGELPLHNGTVTSFKDAIIIMTSNLGARQMGKMAAGTTSGFGDQAPVVDKTALSTVAQREFETFFSPEFRNRLDKVVVFHPLTEEGLGKVLDVKLESRNEEYESKFGVRLSLTPAVRHRLVQQGLKERHLGARPLVRAFESDVLTAFGRYIGGDEIEEGTQVRVFHRDEVFTSHTATSQELVFAIKPDPSIHRAPKEVELFKEPQPLVIPIQNDEIDDRDGDLEPEEQN